MGQAKNRGTKEERVQQAIEAGRVIDRQRTKPYQFRMPRTTGLLNNLWGLFKVVGDKTINEIRAEAILEQNRQRAARAAVEAAEKSNAEIIQEMVNG